MSSFVQRGSAGHFIPFPDRVLGTVVLVVTFVTLVATRSSAVLMPILAGIAMAFALKEREPPVTFTHPGPLSITFAALMGYALLSSTWSLSPWDGIPHVVIATLFALSAYLLCTWINQQSPSRIEFLVIWLVIAFAAGAAVLLFEVLSQQHVKRSFLDAFVFLRPDTANKHVNFDPTGRVLLNPSDLNRNVAALNLLLWPALMGATLLWCGKKRAFLIAAFIAVATIATFGSEHETSKLALLVAVLVFAVTYVSFRFAAVCLTGTWVVSVLAVVPLAWFAYYSLNLQNAKWVQTSGQERIAIWGDLAQRTMDAPFLGIGARMTNKLNSLGVSSLTQPPVQRTQWIIGRHPHNVYLQTWFELGGVGALLLCISGLLALRQIYQTSSFARPFALATAATIIVELGFCWDIWQRWFFALLALAVVVLTLILRLEVTRRSPVGGPAQG